jgi:ATP-dependent DNA ligase
MAPTLVREPFHRDGWVYEEKVDGWRMLVYKDGARVRLVSRNGRDHTRRARRRGCDLRPAVAVAVRLASSTALTLSARTR